MELLVVKERILMPRFWWEAKLGGFLRAHGWNHLILINKHFLQPLIPRRLGPISLSLSLSLSLSKLKTLFSKLLGCTLSVVCDLFCCGVKMAMEKCHKKQVYLFYCDECEDLARKVASQSNFITLQTIKWRSSLSLNILL